MHNLSIEFSRPLDVTHVPAQGSAERLSAEPQECAALAERFALPAIHSLMAELKVSRWRGEGLKVAGQFCAELDQTCVVSLDVFTSTLSDRIESYFLPMGSGPGADTIIEEGDAEPFTNGIIDLGEVVAEAMALALNPYPHKPGVSFSDIVGPDHEAQGNERQLSPFADLGRLKRERG
jgi:uncharacterized metal-binding protein YceD (DUF177 family)